MRKDVSGGQVKRFESGNIKCKPTNAEPPPPPSEQYGTNEGAEEVCKQIGEVLQRVSFYRRVTITYEEKEQIKEKVIDHVERVMVSDVTKEGNLIEKRLCIEAENEEFNIDPDIVLYYNIKLIEKEAK